MLNLSATVHNLYLKAVLFVSGVKIQSDKDTMLTILVWVRRKLADRSLVPCLLNYKEVLLPTEVSSNVSDFRGITVQAA